MPYILYVYILLIISTIILLKQQKTKKSNFLINIDKNLENYTFKILIPSFTEEELNSYKIEIPINYELINILETYLPKNPEEYKIYKFKNIYPKNQEMDLIQITNLCIPEIITYINDYYLINKNFTLPFFMKNYNTQIFFLSFFPIISSLYTIYIYFKLNKLQDFKKQHKDFSIFYKDNLSLIKIQRKLMPLWKDLIILVFILIGAFYLKYANLPNYIYMIVKIFIIFSIIFISRFSIIKLHKHFLFIKQIENFSFIEKNKDLYISKYDLNKLIEVINNI